MVMTVSVTSFGQFADKPVKELNRDRKKESLLAETKSKLKCEDVLAVWKTIYCEWFDMEIDISNLQIPKNYNPKKHFLVLVDQNITMNAVVSAMRKRFSVRLYDVENLDANVKKNDRNPLNGNYVILLKKKIEADKAFLPADKLAQKRYKGITLLERLLLEVLYYNETGDHLDIHNITLCSGSRDTWNGNYAVDWGGKSLEVYPIYDKQPYNPYESFWERWITRNQIEGRNIRNRWVQL